MTQDLTERIQEQLGPIIEALRSRTESPLTDRDKAAAAHALVEASIMGARVGVAWVVATAAEAGIDLSIDVSSLRGENLWPEDQ